MLVELTDFVVYTELPVRPTSSSRFIPSRSPAPIVYRRSGIFPPQLLKWLTGARANFPASFITSIPLLTDGIEVCHGRNTHVATASVSLLRSNACCIIQDLLLCLVNVSCDDGVTGAQG